MDSNTSAFYLIVALEVVFCAAWFFRLRRHRQRLTELLEDGDIEPNLPNRTRSAAARLLGSPSSVNGTSATILATADTTRNRQQQTRFAPYFPAAEVTQSVVDGSVVRGEHANEDDEDGDETKDEDTPYGKACYLVSAQNKMTKSPTPPPLH